MIKVFSREAKKRIIDDFRNYVSPHKADVFQSYGLDFIMGRREGIHIWDVDGRRKLINCHSNGGVFNLGHRNTALISVLKNALESVDIGNHHFMSEQRAALARKLALLTPGDLNYSIFGVSGGEAIDLALKLARGYTQRSDIIRTEGAYHGHTGLALAAGEPKYRNPFGIFIPGFKSVPFNDVDALKQLLSPRTAAVILETVQATSGIVVPDLNYMKEVRRLCSENGTLLILDEVQSGLGRTGRMWAFEHFGIIPDMLVSGKGLSGGLYPMSVTMIRESIMNFFKDDPFIHVSTFGGAELGAVVSLEVLKITSNPAFLNHVEVMGNQLREGYEQLLKKFPRSLAGYSQLGMMTSLRFHDAETGPLFTRAAYDAGIWALFANNDSRAVQILPPLVATSEEVAEILKRIRNALRRLPVYRLLSHSLRHSRKQLTERTPV